MKFLLGTLIIIIVCTTLLYLQVRIIIRGSKKKPIDYHQVYLSNQNHNEK